MEKKKYVVGFMFDPTFSNVVLIRKCKPEWQKGLLNGVGGKVEDFDPYTHDAMRREFMEEAGLDLVWSKYGSLSGDAFTIDLFFTNGNVHRAVAQTEEAIEVWPVDVLMNRCDTIPNVRWLVQMARSFAFGETALTLEVTESQLKRR